MCHLIRVKGCFDALDKKYVSMLFVNCQAINCLLFTAKDDYCWCKFTILLLLSWLPSCGLDL